MPAAYIYGLFDPRELIDFDNCRYIGQTTYTLNMRQYGHVSDARYRKTPRHSTHWIRQLLNEGIKPFILMFELILMEGDDEDAFYDAIDAAERKWIAYGRANGWRLTNQNDGGNGNRGFHHSDETKAVLSAANRGRKRSEEVCRKIGDAHRGVPESAESRQTMSLAALEKLKDPKELQRLGDISRAHKATEDKTPLTCDCGCGPFKGQRGMNYHLNNSPFHSDDPLIRDFCPEGHAMTPENTVIRGLGSRYCRICESKRIGDAAKAKRAAVKEQAAN